MFVLLHSIDHTSDSSHASIKTQLSYVCLIGNLSSRTSVYCFLPFLAILCQGCEASEEGHRCAGAWLCYFAMDSELGTKGEHKKRVGGIENISGINEF